LRLTVAPQVAGQGGLSGDGVVLYNNPSDPNDPFNGGTTYTDGVGGVYVKFQICNGTNDLIVNLHQASPVRYLNLDYSVRLAPPDPAAYDRTGKILQQFGHNLNEIANDALYSNGVFQTCSGMFLDAMSGAPRTIGGANMYWKDPALYDPVVLNCLNGSGSDMANLAGPTSRTVAQRVDACTWIIQPALDSTGLWKRAGVVDHPKKGSSSNLAGGQFHMPFLYQVQKLGCTP
jgi:hypothetical protein